jgi:hypothetical protein
MVVPTGRLLLVAGVTVGCGATSPEDSTVALRAHADVARTAIVRTAVPYRMTSPHISCSIIGV